MQTLEYFRLVRLLTPVARVIITVASGGGTSDRGKQPFADFGHSRSDPDKRSLAPVGEGNESGRDREFLEVSARLRARERETACASSGSFPPRKSLVRAALYRCFFEAFLLRIATTIGALSAPQQQERS